jgi:acetate kinase
MDVARVIALALNAGSSSLKPALNEVEPGAALAAPAGPRLERPGGLGSG